MKIRYVFIFLSFLCFLVNYLVRNNIILGLIAMVNQTAVYGEENQEESEDGPYIWDESIQSIIISSFYWGYLATNFPTGRLAERYGGKYLIGIGGLVATSCSLLAPVASSVDWKLLVATRVIMGLAQGTAFPAMQCMISSWIPPLERSTSSTIIYSGQMAGLISANLITGLIIDWIGWEASFYIIGCFGLVWFLAWQFLIFAVPEEHPKISQKELNYIKTQIGASKEKKQSPKIPWKSLLLSVPVWACILAQVTFNWYFFVFMTYTQDYLKYILNMDIGEIGIIVGTAFTVTFLMSYIHGIFADYAIGHRLWSKTVHRKFVVSWLEFGPFLCYILLCYVENRKALIFFIYLAALFTAGNSAGYLVNNIDLTPNFAGTIQGVANTLSTVGGILCPIIIGSILQNQTMDEYQTVFRVTAVISLTGGVIYLVFGSGEEQSWNTPHQSKLKEKQNDVKLIISETLQ